MPNKNYRRGRISEYRAMKDLAELGYYAIRSAGSHGHADVIGISKTDIILLTIKREKDIKKIRYAEDIKRLRELHVPFNVSKELWIWKDRHGWEKKHIGDV